MVWFGMGVGMGMGMDWLTGDRWIALAGGGLQQSQWCSWRPGVVGRGFGGSEYMLPMLRRIYDEVEDLGVWFGLGLFLAYVQDRCWLWSKVNSNEFVIELTMIQ